MQQLKFAIQDFIQGALRFRIWFTLGLLEVRQRYQRSVLGPWWASISMLVFIIAMGSVFSRLLDVRLSEYFPFFSAGYLLWCLISTCINESTDLFRSNSGFIKQIKLPYNVYVFKFMTKNVVLFFHNFLVYVLVLCYFSFFPGWRMIFAIPGFIILLLNLYWICFLVGLLSTRFRDMVPIVNSCLQILFFVTPISWDQKLLGEHSIFIKLNPISYLIDAVRDPLLGKNPSFTSFSIAAVIGLMGVALILGIFSRVRSRVIFWID